MRIGLLGGSFNPAHGGHRRISLFSLATLGVDEIWWLVSPGNPLKPSAGMAPLPARIHSAMQMARRAPIRVTAIEALLGTRYTCDTLRALQSRYPAHDFCWLMGSDNLAQFHRWRAWREIARSMPIAVIARPGYDRSAMGSPAMAWLRKYRVSAASFRTRDRWSAPTLVMLRFDPDPRCATAIRRADPDWASHMPQYLPRDQVSHRLISPDPAIQQAGIQETGATPPLTQAISTIASSTMAGPTMAGSSIVDFAIAGPVLSRGGQ